MCTHAHTHTHTYSHTLIHYSNTNAIRIKPTSSIRGVQIKERWLWCWVNQGRHYAGDGTQCTEERSRDRYGGRKGKGSKGWRDIQRAPLLALIEPQRWCLQFSLWFYKGKDWPFPTSIHTSRLLREASLLPARLCLYTAIAFLCTL